MIVDTYTAGDIDVYQIHFAVDWQGMDWKWAWQEEECIRVEDKNSRSSHAKR